MRKIALIVYVNKRVALAFLIILLIGAFTITLLLNHNYEITDVRFEAIEFQGSFEVKDKILLEKIFDMLDSKEMKKKNKPINNPKYRMIVNRRIGKEIYLLRDSKNIYRRQETIQIPHGLTGEIEKILLDLEDLSPFGALLPWEEVENFFPRYSKATVRDLETGLAFQVQRRAGSSHADVQPLTKNDTAILKKIYNKTWSWRRRAIVVEKDGLRIAASMHGMPHGAGAISGNNFPGHFCIHFLGSKVHGSGIENLAHQIMVWKSAGKFEEFLLEKSPEDFPELFFTILEQRDETLLLKVMSTNEKMVEKLKLEHITRSKMVSYTLEIDNSKEKVIRGKAILKYVDLPEKVIQYELKLIKQHNFEGWRISEADIFSPVKQE